MNGDREFRLRPGEPVPDGIRRIALGQIDLVLDRVQGNTDEDLGTAVHEARKSLKRLRAVVKLARTELGNELSARENATFRDAGRALSGARDSEVMIEVLDALVERYPVEAGLADLGTFRARLVESYEGVRAELGAGPAAPAEVERSVRAARDRVGSWPLEDNGFDALAPGLARAYKRGRRLGRAARREPSPENLHDWRKRVKDLWHSLQILQATGPPRVKRLTRSAHELSELLGEDHDIVVLEERVVDRPGDFPDLRSAEILRDMGQRRRAELQLQAFAVAAQLYRRPTRKFVRRIEKGWRKRAAG